MQSRMTSWQAAAQAPRLVQFFRGVFDQLGVRVADSGEQFTCRHLGDRIELEPALDPARVDYTVEVETAQVRRLAEHASRGDLGPDEQYRVVAALFTPATAAALRHPVLSHPLLRRLAGSEELIHVRLTPPPAEEPEAAHTLVYANRRWLVLPGLHGKAARVFRLSPEEALGFQRRALTVLKTNSWGEWFRFARWYRKWRKGVSSRV